MKKLIAVLFIACVLIFSTVTVASASMSDSIAPMAENYVNAYANLRITSGEADISAVVNGKIGITTKVTIHLYLQQYKNGKWVDYDDWLKSENTVRLSLTKTIPVPAGYKYRAKASCYAYAGSQSEHVTKYSGEVQ